MKAAEQSPVILLDPADNVVVARMPLAAGTTLGNGEITVKTDIPPGHKVAARFIKEGDPVLKCNTVIGYASRDVEPGTHMHNETIRFSAAEKSYSFCQDYRPIELVPENLRRTFMGYLRPDGQAGTRNCIAVIVCSNCAATVARKIASHFTPEILEAYPNVDAVVPLITSSGCGLEKTGDPMRFLRRVLGGHIKNPNMAGAVVCALGCESNNIDAFFQEAGLAPGTMLKRLVIQEEGGARRTVSRGIELVEAMLPIADKNQRQPLPAGPTRFPASPPIPPWAGPWTSWPGRAAAWCSRSLPSLWARRRPSQAGRSPRRWRGSSSMS